MKNVNIKIQLVIACLLGCMSMTPAAAQQSFTIDASQVVSTFSFRESNDPKNIDFFGTSAYNPNITSAYSFGYRRVFDFGLIARGSVGMRNGGASTVIDQTNYQWDLKYIELKVGAGYQYALMDKLGVYMTLSPYLAYMMKANQRLDNEDFDIKKSGEMKSVDFGLQLTPGAQFTVSDFISVYGEFSYAQGLTNLETGSTDQNSYNVAYLFTLGLAFSIE